MNKDTTQETSDILEFKFFMNLSLMISSNKISNIIDKRL